MPGRPGKPTRDEQRLFLDSIVENIPDMIFVKDARHLRFVMFNRAGERLLGYRRQDLIGRNDYDFFPKDEADFFTAKDREVLRNRKLLDIPEEPIQTKAGLRILHTKKIPIRDGRGRPLYLLGISEDITKLKHRERQLLESQKLESLGRLSAGIAHEFNNILTGVMGLARLIREERPAAGGDADEIIAQCRRAAELVGQLLVFSRQKPPNRRKLDLNAVVEGSRKMLLASLSGSSDLRTKPGRGLPAIDAEATQVEQILLNLCLNARDAVAGGGQVLIETSAVRLARPLAGKLSEIPPGRYVRLAVADTGAGIAPEDQSRIFEPFFTTKEFGRGSGLGLSVVYGIVKQHGGHIDFSSKPGEGTTFHIYWPAAKGRAAAPRPSNGEREETSLRGRETLLIAEDDAVARAALSRYLRRLGYAVIAAHDGAHAERILRAKANGIDAALLDIKMPKFDGLQVYERTFAKNPRLKVVFMSGFAETRASEKISRIGLPLLMKPFVPETAARRLRQALDGK